MRRKSGATIVELSIACFIALLALAATGATLQVGDRVISEAYSKGRAKEMLYRAVNAMAPSIREARTIDPYSDPTHLILNMPATDGSGAILLPEQDGDSVMFYMSDQTGDPAQPGPYLWKSVDDVPVKALSTQGEWNDVDLGLSGLTFQYVPAANADPSFVQVSITAQQQYGQVSSSGQLTTVIGLRNHSSNQDSDDESDDDNSS